MDPERVRILDAAERLFYANGLQQVGMDQVRGDAGVSLKRLYREFPSKDQLIEAYLLRRDARWLNALGAAVAPRGSAAERIQAAFDWLGEWFAEPGFRGCAFTNSFGELGTGSSTVAAIAAAHKAEFRAVFVDLVDQLASELARPLSPGLGEQVYLLAEGAITAAAVTGDLEAARNARAAAATLISAAQTPAARSRVDDPDADQPRARPGRMSRLNPFRRLRPRR